MHSLRNVAALIAAVTILQLAGGLLGVLLPTAMTADGLSATPIGLVTAIYSAGFMLGARAGPHLLARVGHIRVFSACAAITCASILALHWADAFFGWAAMRFFAGAAIALMFTAIESWLAGSTAKEERGGVIGVYMVSTKAALATGPFLIVGAAAPYDSPLMIAALFMALSIVPVCFTTAAQPEPPKAQPLALGAQFATAPAAVVAAFGAGLINSGVLALAPLFALEVFGPGSQSGFQAMAWFGSLLLQYPAGKLSDVVDRRVVIAGLTGLAAVSALGLTLLGGAGGFWAAALLFAFWGAGALSFYGVAVAHMADRAEPSQMARATSGLLFVWGAGSILGPAVMGALVELGGLRTMFAFAAICGGVLGLLMMWRRSARAAPLPAEKEPFIEKTATSVAQADLAYGDAPAPKPAK